MTTYYRNATVPIPQHYLIGAALGTSAGAKLTSLDEGKLVKLSTTLSSTYVLCASGNDIEGQLVAVEPHTVNDGYGFGTVQQRGNIVVTIGAGTLAQGDYVVCGAISAVGTAIPAITTGAQTNAKAPNVIAGAGVVFKWRICSLLGGAGTVGTNVLIERVV